MAMPRPTGKALKIAKEVIPGLNKDLKGKKLSKRNVKPIKDVESKIININDHLKRDFYETIKK